MKYSKEELDQLFFSLLEGELSPEEQANLCKEIEGDEQLKEEWALWQLTIAEPEALEFPDKASLLAIAEDKKRVAPWFSWAAAATILLLLGASFFLIDKGLPQDKIARSPIGTSADSLEKSSENSHSTKENLTSPPKGEEAKGEVELVVGESKSIRKERTTVSPSSPQNGTSENKQNRSSATPDKPATNPGGNKGALVKGVAPDSAKALAQVKTIKVVEPQTIKEPEPEVVFGQPKTVAVTDPAKEAEKKGLAGRLLAEAKSWLKKPKVNFDLTRDEQNKPDFNLHVESEKYALNIKP